MWVPSDRALYKLLTDWGGVIGGVFALIAGWAAYRAGQNQAGATLAAARDQVAVTKQVAHDQTALSAEKDGRQAYAMAMAIYPEILQVKVSLERARGIILEKFPEDMDAYTNRWNALTGPVEMMIRETKVVEPPLIREMVDNLFIMGEAGATNLQLLSVILQYNRIVETLATKAEKDATNLKPSDPLGDLSALDNNGDFSRAG
jgi:hypothetical protein